MSSAGRAKPGRPGDARPQLGPQSLTATERATPTVVLATAPCISFASDHGVMKSAPLHGPRGQQVGRVKYESMMRGCFERGYAFLMATKSPSGGRVRRSGL